VQKHTNHPTICHPLSGLPLFDWRPFPVLTAAPVVVRKLAERYGISIAHATIVARLAGLGGSEVRQ
jgi:hypothetical protein